VALTREQLRKYWNRLRLVLADYPEINEMVEGVNLSNDHLELALEHAVEDWNLTPPIIGTATIENHPWPGLMLQKAVIDLLRTEVLQRIRNTVDISDGGASINHTQKIQLLRQAATDLQNEYETKKKQHKIQQNLAGGWGGVESLYAGH